MKIGIGIPEQIIGFDAGGLHDDYAVTADALGFDYLTCVDHVLGTTHNRREPPFPPGGISTQARLDTPRIARAVDGASINRDSTGPCRPGSAVAA
jgi:hypothetical protein